MKHEIKVEKQVTKGQLTWTYYVDGVEKNKLERLGDKNLRHITGHTDDIKYGIWDDDRCCHYYGQHIYIPPDEYPLLTSDDTARERALKIQKRIRLIKDWVEKCKADDAAKCEEATVVVWDNPEEMEERIRELEAQLKA